MTDDRYWFLKPPEEIKKMRDALPKVHSPISEEFMRILRKAEPREVDIDFVESFLDYLVAQDIHPDDIALAMNDARIDWEIE